MDLSTVIGIIVIILIIWAVWSVIAWLWRTVTGIFKSDGTPAPTITPAPTPPQVMPPPTKTTSAPSLTQLALLMYEADSLRQAGYTVNVKQLPVASIGPTGEINEPDLCVQVTTPIRTLDGRSLTAWVYVMILDRELYPSETPQVRAEVMVDALQGSPGRWEVPVKSAALDAWSPNASLRRVVEEVLSAVTANPDARISHTPLPRFNDYGELLTDSSPRRRAQGLG